MYRVYSVAVNNILVWIWEVLVYSIMETVYCLYLCVLFVGDGVKRQPRCSVRLHIGLEVKSGESRGSE
jgi:hypothetical protein